MVRPFALMAALLAGPVAAQGANPVALVEQCGGYRMTVALEDGADLAATEAAAEVLAERLGGESLFGLALFDAVTFAAPGELVIHRAGRTALGMDRELLLMGGGRLDIYLGLALQDSDAAGAGERVFADDLSGGFLRVATPALIHDIGISAAEASIDAYGAVAVSFAFDAEGAAAFGQATLDHQGEVLALVLNDRLLTAPRVMGHIPGGQGMITGSFSRREAEALARVLQAGVLAHEITVLREEIVPAEGGGEGPCAALSVQED